jgi:peptide/nickel transport system permease protein
VVGSGYPELRKSEEEPDSISRMIGFVLRKTLYGIAVLLGVVTLVFVIFNLSPSDPARTIAGQNDSPEVLASIRQKLGLDLPVGQRYLLWLNDLSPISVHSSDESSRLFFDNEEYSGFRVLPVGGDMRVYLKSPYLRRSYKTERKVGDILMTALPGTALLAVAAILLAVLIGIPMGIVAALNRDKPLDRWLIFGSAMGMSGPSFFVAIIVAWIGGLAWSARIPLPLVPFLLFAGLMAVRFFVQKNGRSISVFSTDRILLYSLAGWFILAAFGFSPVLYLPGTGLPMTGSLWDVDVFEGRILAPQHLILPAITLGIRPLAVVVQMTRGSMLDVMNRDFIRTARAKGLPEHKVIFGHALRNAITPVVTAISGWFASMLAGAVFVEFVFGWNGLGLEVFQALEREDLPVVMGAVMLIAALFTFINLSVDLLYKAIDPRVR